MVPYVFVLIRGSLYYKCDAMQVKEAYIISVMQCR
jgi:hypothetical protein